MKKTVSLLLALVLACSMGLTALADDVTISTAVPEVHTVTVEAEGGRIIVNNKVCEDTVLTQRQKEQTYWIVPDQGRELEGLYYNGEDVTGQMEGCTFTAPALTGDAALKAVFGDAAAYEEDGYTVGGTVTDAEGRPVPGATVDIGGNTGTTDEDGRFTIPDVPPGTYPVVITDGNGNIIGIGEITVGELEEDGPKVTESENGSPVITPGTDSTNIDLTIVLKGEGGIELKAVKVYTRDEPQDAQDDPAETVTAPSETGSAAVTPQEGEANAQPDTAAGISGQSPQTGDTVTLWLWAAALLLSGGGLAGCILFERKKKQDAD